MNTIVNPSAASEEQISAAHSLSGRTLASGWKVIDKAVAKPGSTGSHFSVCYFVEKDGQLGFLKALNLLKFLRDEQSDFGNAMSEMLDTFNFERELVSRCADKKLSKVSKLLFAGEESIPGFFINKVLYLIFERADGDVRAHINFSENVDILWKLKSLHQIATGLKQLHGINISHQDLKPSNVFLFGKRISKIGDLGRSLCRDYEGPHSGLDFSGDRSYAPPDFFFGFMLGDWNTRVLSVDYYLLGSMMMYYFTGRNMTSMLFSNLDSGIDPSTFKTFEEALPYLIDSFDKCLNILASSIVIEHVKDEVIELVKVLCYPCPKTRGKVALKNKTVIFGFEKVVTKLDVIVRKTELILKGQKTTI